MKIEGQFVEDCIYWDCIIDRKTEKYTLYPCEIPEIESPQNVSVLTLELF